ncbi:unnamed protein product [Lampetra fluviatilis]
MGLASHGAHSGNAHQLALNIISSSSSHGVPLLPITVYEVERHPELTQRLEKYISIESVWSALLCRATPHPHLQLLCQVAHEVTQLLLQQQQQHHQQDHHHHQQQDHHHHQQQDHHHHQQ